MPLVEYVIGPCVEAVPEANCAHVVWVGVICETCWVQVILASAEPPPSLDEVAVAVLS